MIYSVDTDLWENTQYADVGYHIQPVLHGDQALACKRRTDISKNEADDFIFKRYDEELGRCPVEKYKSFSTSRLFINIQISAHLGYSSIYRYQHIQGYVSTQDYQ